MRTLLRSLTLVALLTASLNAADVPKKPLKVFILAGQSNMEGHDALPDFRGNVTDADQKAFLKKFEADLISPAEAAMYQRGASNAGYHYLGCAKTFALMGVAYAEATLRMMKK